MATFQYEGKDLEAMSFAKKYHEWIVSLFRAYLGKRVAEVGAGSGSFTELLLKESIEEIVAIEPSQQMFGLLQTGAGADTRVSARNNFFTEVSGDYADHFDSIIYVNVLEHVEKDEEELRAVFKALKPGGYVCIFVPALPWLYSEFDKSIGHYRRYTKKELLTRVQNAGFKVVKIGFFDFFGILPWYVVFTLLKKGSTAGTVTLYDRVVVPIARVLESLIRPPIGKNLFVVAQK